jgi:mono/diheme cytochrome c family protein
MLTRPRASGSLAVRKAVFVLLLLVIVAAVAFTALHNGKWVVPESAKQVQNPIPSSESESAILAARPVYLDKCSSCHGRFGKGDGHDAASHDPRPTNFTLPLTAATDGELFYKITQGHRPMPSYKKKLTEEQRWQLVLLIRAFGRSAEANVPAAAN